MVALVVKNPPDNAGNIKDIETWVQSWIRKIPLKRASNPLQYSCLEIPWTEDPDGLQSIGSQSVRYD